MKIDATQIIDWNKALVLKSKEPHGIIKQGIEAALHRTEYYDTEVEKAAALFHSLINNHYFLQANKRTAMVALLVYLSDDTLSDDFLESLVMDTVNANLQVDDIVERLRSELTVREGRKVLVQEIFQKYEALIEKLINM